MCILNPLRNLLYAMGSIVLSSGEDGFYTKEELEQLKDESLAPFAKKFGNMSVRKNSLYKYKPATNRFYKGGSSSTSSKGRYKTGLVDISKQFRKAVSKFIKQFCNCSTENIYSAIESQMVPSMLVVRC